MIPARYAAARFPGKLMKDLGGKTIIKRTYEAAVKTKLFKEVFVVTDSKIIKEEVLNFGGKVIMSKKEHKCGSDRIAEAIEFINVDVVVNVQGDEPFIKKDSLAKVLSVFYEKDADQVDLASLMRPLKEWKDIENPNNVKVIVNRDRYALYFSRSPIPYPRDRSVSHTYYQHIGIYAFRKQALLDFYKLPMQSLEASEKIECIRYLEYGKNIKMVLTSEAAIGIDTPEDLDKAREFLEKYPNVFD